MTCYQTVFSKFMFLCFFLLNQTIFYQIIQFIKCPRLLLSILNITDDQTQFMLEIGMVWVLSLQEMRVKSYTTSIIVL